jgi:glycogen(starch) synthase
LAEIVDGTDAALLFEPGNSTQLADAIERTLLEPDTATTLRRRADALLSDRYSWEAIAASTVQVYERAKQ